MKKKELDSLIQKFTPKAYELAYTLVPDDLQASQIVVDATTTFLITELAWLEALEVENLDKNEELEVKKDFYLIFMKSIFALGLKRFSQLPKIMNNDNEGEKFFLLDGKTRALVHLKYKENLSIPELIEISSLKKSEVMSRLFQGMELLGEIIVPPLREFPPVFPGELLDKSYGD